ncbi:MAG: BON domain-containing protein, partial [Bacteroidetes bacterium]|nr:BON domain-containing protein [Bacteroidota bacterium]
MAIIDVKEAIKEQLDWDDRVSSSDIGIEVFDGTITLLGEVPNYASKVAAEEDALAVAGVKNVKNKIEVKYPEAFNGSKDEQLKTTIEQILKNDYHIDSSKITVSVENGNVTLNGPVDAFWKKGMLKSYLHGMSGLADIKDELSVEPENEKPDREIKNEITKAFDRNDLIDSRNIVIEVDGGTVFLTGNVPDYP